MSKKGPSQATLLVELALDTGGLAQ